jgi:hypothetical protein
LIHISQSSKATGNERISYFEVVLDYASLRKKSVDSFSVHNIVFVVNIEINRKAVEEFLPRSFVERLRRADQAAVAGNRNAIEFLNTLNTEFLAFESDETVSKLRDTISFDPPTVAELMDLTPRMQAMLIADSDYPVALPGSTD